MILSFRDRETERLWWGDSTRRLPPWILGTAIRKLRLLNEAASLAELVSPPGNRLEALSGNRLGQHSIRINDQWRICFRWSDRGPEDVQIVDYHS
jgi:proteic killer suppression protein